MKHLSYDTEGRTRRLPGFFSPAQGAVSRSAYVPAAAMDQHRSQYHSFSDVELSEPSSSSSWREQTQFPASSHGDRPMTAKMQRQDSGYESYTTSPRTSTSYNRPTTSRRKSNASCTAAVSSRPRTRPTTRRSTQSHHNYQTPPPLHIVNAGNANNPTSYFQFPPPDTDQVEESLVPAAQTPPQTTHYWTSDSTRRIEYAAIDAASRGVKGWIKRNLVPDCFVPKDERHIAFDDDTGSVRRYRLELDDGPDEQVVPSNSTRRRKGWRI